MQVDVYKSVKNGDKYLSVPAGTDLATTPFPETLDPDLLKLSPFKSSLDIQRGQKRIALNCDDVIDQIEENGYATHGATITITVSTTP